MRYKEFFDAYLRLFSSIVRVIAVCIGVVAFFATIGLAMDRDSTLDPVLRWGLVGLMVVICVLSVLMLRAPIKRHH